MCQTGNHSPIPDDAIREPEVAWDSMRWDGAGMGASFGMRRCFDRLRDHEWAREDATMHFGRYPRSLFLGKIYLDREG